MQESGDGSRAPVYAVPALLSTSEFAAVLRLSLFGPVLLRSGSREVRIKSLKLRAMLGYIALSESLVETRERLVGLLWSEFGGVAGSRRAAPGDPGAA